MEEAVDVISQREAKEQVRRDKHAEGGQAARGLPTQPRCRTCGETGQNSRTCQNDTIIVEY